MTSLAHSTRYEIDLECESPQSYSSCSPTVHLSSQRGLAGCKPKSDDTDPSARTRFIAGLTVSKIDLTLSRLRTGKIPSETLIRAVFRYRGMRDSAVILGSSLGEDAALVRIDKRVIVLKTDPVTATTSDPGWLSVHINANDIACRGARPRWFLCDLLLPERTNKKMIEEIMQQIDQAARKLHVAIVGGHTEVTPYLKQPIVVGYMVGLLNPRQKFVTSRGARPGDNLIMTKTAGIEGTTLLAMDFTNRLRKMGVGRHIERAKSMRHSISIVDDALTAVRAGGVHAMHDPTEGGLLQGVWEISEASGTGFILYESKIPVRVETKKICAALKVDALRLMSSGCLLVAADKGKSSRILHNLRRHGIQATIIGEFTENRKGRRLVRSDGTHISIGPSERDELYRVIETQGKH